MGTANQIAFTLKTNINGREVTPDTIGLSLFNQFNAEVEAFLAAGQRKASLEDVRFEIKDGSYRLLLTLPAMLLAMVQPDLRKLHRQDSLAEIDPKRAEVVQQWQKRARTDPFYQVAIDSPESMFKPIQITQETEYRSPDEDDWVAVEKYIVGTVDDMGGATAANVHLVSDDTGKRLVAASTEDFLRDQKENFLYRKVQVHVAAVENVKTGELRDIRLIAFVGKGPSYDEAELEAAIEKGTRAWAQVPDSAAWIRSMRGSEDE
jgi:hypothetical protein